MSTLAELFDVHGLISYDKQLTLLSLVKGRSPVSYRNGLLTFGSELSLPVQLLGSHSEYDNTWLWAWANPGLSGWRLEASAELKAFGIEHAVQELFEPKFPLPTFDGHYLSMVATGVLSGACYYRFPYHEGAAFLLVPTAPEINALSDLSAHTISNRAMDFFGQYECHHRTAVEQYLRFKGFTFASDGPNLSATSAHGQSLDARFDPSGRLLEIQAVITAPVYPAGV